MVIASKFIAAVHLLLTTTSRSYCVFPQFSNTGRCLVSSSLYQSRLQRISSFTLSVSRPCEFCFNSITPIYAMTRRSSQAGAVAAFAKVSDTEDDKIEALDDTSKEGAESKKKSTLKKGSKQKSVANSVKSKSPAKKSKGPTASTVVSGEGDKESDTKKKSPKKRASKGSTKDASRSASAETTPPKKKSKTGDHQRWTERTPLTRHWDPETAAKSGSYTFTIISWNVAGLRTFIKKNPDVLSNLAKKYDADVICLQETKLQEDNLIDPKLKLKEYFDEKLEGYECHFNCSVEKKGYSGTSMFIKKYGDDEIGDGTVSKKGKKQATLGAFFASKGNDVNSAATKTSGGTKLQNSGVPVSTLHPVTLAKDLGFSAHDGEGRTITAEFPLFFVTNVYVPNSGQKLDRLSYRTTQWDRDFVVKMQQLEKDGGKPIIWLGDLNVAYDEKDTWNEGAKHLVKSAGTTPEERASFAEQLSAGFVDAFRQLHPDGKGHYSYWSQRAGNREPNKGLRLDYFICSKILMTDGDNNRKAVVRDSYMIPDQLGSDHCPIVLEIEIKK